jgi:predicted dehydrogenase
MITWESKSCNPFQYYDRGRGVTIHGDKGTVLLDRNSYQAFDLDGKSVREVKEGETSATTDTRGEGVLDVYHMQNLADAIRDGVPLNAAIGDAGISTQLCHYGNLAQKAGGSIHIDPQTGRVVDNKIAEGLWSRKYEKGWEVNM